MEKVYKTMRNVGAGTIVLGVIMIIAGVTSGILTIVGGARLLNNKKNIMF